MVGPVAEKDKITDLGDMLQRPRETDPSFRVFGAKQHPYSFDPTLAAKKPRRTAVERNSRPATATEGGKAPDIYLTRMA
jgi:hypothetical protein